MFTSKVQCFDVLLAVDAFLDNDLLPIDVRDSLRQLRSAVKLALRVAAVRESGACRADVSVAFSKKQRRHAHKFVAGIASATAYALRAQVLKVTALVLAVEDWDDDIDAPTENDVCAAFEGIIAAALMPDVCATRTASNAEKQMSGLSDSNQVEKLAASVLAQLCGNSS